ncbi:MAG: ribosomal large subunit pseudouridine synthase [Verrucomicrobiota bacterium]|jgi:23S rRNA pseudouridine2605 synthase
MVRLQKFLAEAGVASRRASEVVITEGRVRVNGKVVTQLGTKVNPDTDEIAVDGTILKVKRKLYIALHKPPGYVSTRKDELNRRTIHDLLPVDWTNIYSVGRLDAESEGLLFVTNDGDFALKLTHPRYGVRKKYIALVEGRVEPHLLKKFTTGVMHEGDLLKAEKVKLLSANNSHSEVELELGEGKNREVRRLFESIGLNVVRLARVQVGKIRIAELPMGKWRTLTETEIKSLISPV